MTSPTDQRKYARLLEDLGDPEDDSEKERLVTELLEGLRDLASRLGGADPVIEALSQSIVLSGDAGLGEAFDDTRRTLVDYLASLDTAAPRPNDGPSPRFVRSPALPPSAPGTADAED